MNELQLYWRYIRLHFLTELQYGGWPLNIVMMIIRVAADPLDAVLLVDRFGGIGGMTGSQILFVYAMAVSAFGLAELFGRGFDVFPHLVRGGDFDRFLLRPRSLYIQTATVRFHLNRLPRAIGMTAIAVVLILGQGVFFGPVEIALFLLALIGGALTYTGQFLISSVIAIFTIQSFDWIDIFTNGSYQVAKVPLSLLPDWLRRTFTYVMPMFLFCYFPSASICRWDEPYALGFLALPAGVAVLGFSSLLWKFGVRHYKSTGS